MRSYSDSKCLSVRQVYKINSSSPVLSLASRIKQFIHTCGLLKTGSLVEADISAIHCACLFPAVKAITMRSSIVFAITDFSDAARIIPCSSKMKPLTVATPRSSFAGLLSGSGFRQCAVQLSTTGTFHLLRENTLYPADTNW